MTKTKATMRMTKTTCECVESSEHNGGIGGTERSVWRCWWCFYSLVVITWLCTFVTVSSAGGVHTHLMLKFVM